MALRRSIPLVITICILLCILPVNVFAAKNGTCGTNLSWTLDDSGTLTISGTGDMETYDNYDEAPWYASNLEIKKVVVGNDVTSIGKFAFTYASNLAELTLPEGLTLIDGFAFSACSALTSVTIPSTVTYIGDIAFSACDAMETMVFTGDAPELYDKNSLPCAVEGFQVVYDSTKSGWDNAVWKNFTMKDAHASVNTGDTVSISVSATSVSEGDYIFIQIQPDDSFAAAEIQLQYDSGFFSYVENTAALSNDSYALYDATITAENGILKLADYGVEKNFYKIPFRARKEGTSTISLVSAKFSNAEDAASKDLSTATIQQDSVEITILHPRQNVTLPTWFEGETTVDYGSDYTFTLTGDNIYYDYKITATVNGETVDVISENGTYIIRNVTGPLVITATRTPKQFTITFQWENGEKPETSNAVTYGKDCTFSVPTLEHCTVVVKSIRYAKSGNVSFTVDEDGVITIQGTDVIDNILVIWESTQSEAIVSIVGDASDVEYNTGATPGEDYTFTVHKDEKYTYTVTVTIDGVPVECTVDGDTYTIHGEDVKIGKIVITITKTIKIDNVKVDSYLQVDSLKIWRIWILMDKMEKQNYVYKGTQMMWSEQYKGYCTLVIASEKPTVTSKDLTLQNVTAQAVEYGMDVNKSGIIDANDAQLAYNMYNCYYSTFTEEVTIEKFLRADVNGDGTVDTKDAALIIGRVMQS